MKEIPLTQGKFAQVDDEDFLLVSQYAWAAAKDGNTFYALGYNPVTKKQMRMHILITGVKGLDHWDGNGLNNQRYNLRPATATQNGGNRRKQSGTTSVYKGVTRRKNGWEVNVSRKYCGLYDTELEAAHVYDEIALQEFGDFAKLNFPLDIQ